MRLNKFKQSIKLIDPHARLWANKTELGFKYFKNPAFKGEKEYHCIPGFETDTIGGINIRANIKDDIGTQVTIWKHLYHHSNNIFVEEKPLLHLHWLYGKKLESFYNKKSITSRTEIIKQQKLNEFSGLLPKIFWDLRKGWING